MPCSGALDLSTQADGVYQVALTGTGNGCYRRHLGRLRQQGPLPRMPGTGKRPGIQTRHPLPRPGCNIYGGYGSCPLPRPGITRTMAKPSSPTMATLTSRRWSGRATTMSTSPTPTSARCWSWMGRAALHRPPVPALCGGARPGHRTTPADDSDSLYISFRDQGQVPCAMPCRPAAARAWATSSPPPACPSPHGLLLSSGRLYVAAVTQVYVLNAWTSAASTPSATRTAWSRSWIPPPTPARPSSMCPTAPRSTSTICTATAGCGPSRRSPAPA